MTSFAKLWSNHPIVKGDAPLLDRAVYANQCAINVGAALMRSGLKLNGYTGAWSWNKEGARYPIRAEELARWLASPHAAIAKVEKIAGKKYVSRIAGRCGIIFYKDYWGPGNAGDHIDLWNGSRLTDWTSWARIHVRLGDVGIHTVGGGSDMEKAKAVWFWPLQ